MNDWEAYEAFKITNMKMSRVGVEILSSEMGKPLKGCGFKIVGSEMKLLKGCHEGFELGNMKAIGRPPPEGIEIMSSGYERH